MSATMTKKPKKKKAKRVEPATALNFKQLFNRVQRHESAAMLAKTAVKTGWLTDEQFLVKLTEEEQEAVAELSREIPSYKRAEMVDVSASLPEIVGPMADEHNVVGQKVKLTSGDRTVHVNARLYLTMKKRYPKANVYLSQDPNGTIVIFSERNAVAVLPIVD